MVQLGAIADSPRLVLLQFLAVRAINSPARRVVQAMSFPGSFPPQLSNFTDSRPNILADVWLYGRG
jgi:hypothetical protein